MELKNTLPSKLHTILSPQQKQEMYTDFDYVDYAKQK